jgi:hypothetical protein
LSRRAAQGAHDNAKLCRRYRGRSRQELIPIAQVAVTKIRQHQNWQQNRLLMRPFGAKIYQGSFALDFPIGPIRYRIDGRQNRSTKWMPYAGNYLVPRRWIGATERMKVCQLREYPLCFNVLFGRRKIGKPVDIVGFSTFPRER